MVTGNILKAEIIVTAPGAKEVFNGIGEGAKSTGEQIRKLTPQISALGNTIETLRAKALARKEFLLTETDIGKIKIYNREIKALEAEMSRLQKTGTASLGGIGSAGTKAFSAVRQLAYILPGIGIAGIFSLAFEGLSKFVDGLHLLGHSYNEAAADAEVLKTANKAIGDDVARLNALVAVAKDVALSTNQRKNAIAELQKLYPDYLRNINLENINSAAAGKAIDDLTKSIVNKAIAQAYSQKVAEETFKLDEKKDRLAELVAQREKKNAESTKSAFKGINNDGVLRLAQLSEIDAQIQNETDSLNEQQKIVDKLTGKVKDATAAELEFVKTPKPKPFKEEFIPKFTFTKGDKSFAKQIEESFKHHQLVIDAEFVPAPTAEERFTDTVTKKLAEAVSKTPLIIPIPIDPKIVLRAEQMQEALKNINESIKGALNDSLANIGQTIGEALSGGDIKKAFQQFGTIVGSAVQAIGKQLVALGTAALLAKTALKSLFSNPAVEIAAGVALVAVGAALKNLLSGGVKGFAEGGYTGPGGKYDAAGVVHKGEFVMPQHAVNRLGIGYLNNLAFGRGIQGYANGGFVGGGISGGSSMQVFGQFRISGNDLIAVLANANRSQGRLL